MMKARYRGSTGLRHVLPHFVQTGVNLLAWEDSPTDGLIAQEVKVALVGLPNSPEDMRVLVPVPAFCSRISMGSGDGNERGKLLTSPTR